MIPTGPRLPSRSPSRRRMPTTTEDSLTKASRLVVLHFPLLYSVPAHGWPSGLLRGVTERVPGMQGRTCGAVAMFSVFYVGVAGRDGTECPHGVTNRTTASVELPNGIPVIDTESAIGRIALSPLGLYATISNTTRLATAIA